jgi:HEAT repeat protein
MKGFNDPVWRRYRRNYPKFPGVGKCVDLLRQPNVNGAYQDAVLHDLQENAPEYFDELFAIFVTEKAGMVRNIILAIFADMPAPKAFQVFVDTLTGPDEDLRCWAARGLHRLNTKESKHALWEAGKKEFDTPEGAEFFRKMLQEAKREYERFIQQRESCL